MDIRVIERTVYGNDVLYPHNDAAKVLASLTGRKTLRTDDLKAAVRLGHTVSVEHAQPATRAAIEGLNAPVPAANEEAL